MTATGSHLFGGRINLMLVRESARIELKEILGNPTQKKVIVWDNTLIGSVGLVAEVPFLLQLGVYKMIRLPAENITDMDGYRDVSEFIFLVRPQLSIIDDIIKAIARPARSKSFVVVFVPRKSIHCIKKLEDNRLQDGQTSPFSFSVKEFRLDMLPLDQDVISLDINSAFTDLYLDMDPTPLDQTVRSIGRLQALFGVIPRIYGKGRNAEIVANMMERTRQELMRGGESTAKDTIPQIDAVILLDRSVDLVAVLSTQLTYEGLIDEFFGIRYNSAKFPRDQFSEDVQQVPKNAPLPITPLSVTLTSEENMYSNMRDSNFRSIGRILSKKAREISAAFEERHDAKTVQQLKQFVQKLPHMQQDKISLSRHTTIAELIKQRTDMPEFLDVIYAEQALREEDNSDGADSYIEQCMGKQEPIEKVLRLICLQSLANSGLKPKLLERYKMGIIQCYGTQHLISLHNLEKAGLIKVQESKSFAVVKRSLRLIVEKVDEFAPKDCAYVFSGYAPATVRLVEYLDRPNGWQQIEDILRLIPGPTIMREQKVHKGHDRKNSSFYRKYRSHNSHFTEKPTPDQPQVVLVFFIGGCSYAEIAALRYLAGREEAVTDYIIGTTNIVNGGNLMDSVLANTPHYERQN